MKRWPTTLQCEKQAPHSSYTDIFYSARLYSGPLAPRYRCDHRYIGLVVADGV